MTNKEIIERVMKIEEKLQQHLGLKNADEAKKWRDEVYYKWDRKTQLEFNQKMRDLVEGDMLQLKGELDGMEGK